MCHGKNCIESLVEHFVGKVKRLYEIFPQQLVELTGTCQSLLMYWKKSTKQQQYVITICFEGFVYVEPRGDSKSKNRKLIDRYHYMSFHLRSAHKNCSLKYWISDHTPIVFDNLSGYGVHLFIKELGKSLLTVILESC